MTELLFAHDDHISTDSLELLRDDERLILRSVVDGRERTIILIGRAEARRLAHAIGSAFGSPLDGPVVEVHPWR